MSLNVESLESRILEQLLAEFNETLRCQGRADFSLLDRCPAPCRNELLALLNTVALAYRALGPERAALRGRERAFPVKKTG
jgi:hypothetical protein